MNTRRSRSFFGLAFAAASLLALHLGCASGGGESFAPPPATDTYVLATVTVLDDSRPCVPGDCEPEFFDCASLAPVAIGTTFQIRATQAAAGLALPQTGPGQGVRITVSGTDTATFRGVALEFIVPNPLMPSPVLSSTFGAINRNANFADIDLPCDRINDLGDRESRFVVADTPQMPNAMVTLTEFPVDGAGSVILAEPDGAGGFAPPSYVAGTFSFEALGKQAVGEVITQPRVRVTGCFRVPLPFPERSVSVTPTPAAPAAGCP